MEPCWLFACISCFVPAFFDFHTDWADWEISLDQHWAFDCQANLRGDHHAKLKPNSNFRDSSSVTVWSTKYWLLLAHPVLRATWSGWERVIGSDSETRLLRTLKGNEKRYVVTKVCSIQSAIFLTGRTGSTCSRERSATEDASPSWMSFIIRFSYGEIAFQGIVNVKTCREIEIETERLDDMLVIRKKKKEPKKGQKVLLEGKLVRNIRFCATFCTSYPKKMYMFSHWRCPWSMERTL